MTYDTYEDFESKADWEGGVWELILGYGVDPSEVNHAGVAEAIKAFKDAALDLEAALKDWSRT